MTIACQLRAATWGVHSRGMPASGVLGALGLGVSGAACGLGAGGVNGCGMGCTTATGPLKFGDGSSPTIEVCDWQPTRAASESTAVIDALRYNGRVVAIPGSSVRSFAGLRERRAPGVRAARLDVF